MTEPAGSAVGGTTGGTAECRATAGVADGPCPCCGGSGRASDAVARRRSRRRRVLAALGWAAVALSAVAVAAWVWREPLLASAAGWFVVEDDPAPADYVAVMGGDVLPRITVAARLHREGWARRIILPRTRTGPLHEAGLMPAEYDVCRAFLLREGVPAGDILPPGETVDSTWSEVAALRRRLADLGCGPGSRVLIVTTRFHCRRTRRVVDRLFADSGIDVRLCGAPSEGFDESQWWKSSEGVKTYGIEAAKTVYYWLAY